MAIIEDRFGGRKKKEETDFNGGRVHKKRIVGDGTMSGTGSTGTGNSGGTAFDGSRTRQKRIVGNGTMSKAGADGGRKTSEIGTDRTTPKQIETFKRYMKQKDDAAKLEKAQNWYKQQKQKQQQKPQTQRQQEYSNNRQKIEAVFANTLSKERIKKWKANNKK